MEDSTTWIYVLVVVAFVIFPVSMLLLGIRFLYTTYQFRKDAVEVTGTVVDVKAIERQSDGHRRTYYQPTFEFTGPVGETLRGETLMESESYNFPTGSPHPVLVNLQKPDTVHMPSNAPYYIGLCMITIAGVISYFGIVFVLLGG